LLSVLSLLFGLSSLVLEVAVSLPGKLPFGCGDEKLLVAFVCYSEAAVLQ
jgi:hypothetical protein